MKAKATAKATAKARQRVPRTACGGRWTEAQKKAFIVGALRSASVRWAPKEDAVRAARVGVGVNIATGRKCMLHRCAGCLGNFPRSKVAADHTVPVVGPEGFTTWDQFIARMFVEATGFQVLCDTCHKAKTGKERKVRGQRKNAHVCKN